MLFQTPLAAILSFFLVCFSVVACSRRWKGWRQPRLRGSRAVSCAWRTAPTLPLGLTSTRSSASVRASCPRPPSSVLVPQREMRLHLVGASGPVHVVIEERASGDVLFQRACACLGGFCHLMLPGGRELDPQRPLVAQGLTDGCELTYSRAVNSKLSKQCQAKTKRQAVPIQKFHWALSSFSSQQEHSAQEQLGFCEDYMMLEITRRHSPEAVAELTKESLRVDCTRESIKVTIRGQSVDYTFSRLVGNKGSRGIAGRLVTGWPLCPSRCCAFVRPYRGLTLCLRSTPPGALTQGTRVGIRDFKVKMKGYGMELNGRTGIVKGYQDAKPCDEKDHSFPFLYIVELEVLKLELHLHRRHLVPLEDGNEALDDVGELPIYQPGESPPVTLIMPEEKTGGAGDDGSDSES